MAKKNKLAAENNSGGLPFYRIKPSLLSKENTDAGGEGLMFTGSDGKSKKVCTTLDDQGTLKTVASCTVNAEDGESTTTNTNPFKISPGGYMVWDQVFDWATVGTAASKLE